MSWLSTAFDWISGNSNTIGGIASLIGAGTSLYSGINAAGQADDLAGLAKDNADLQREIALYNQQIGKAGAGDLEQALAAFIGSAGGAGVFSPGRISDLSSGFAREVDRDRYMIGRERDGVVADANAGAYDIMSEILGVSNGLRLPGSAQGTLRSTSRLPWSPSVTAMMEASGMDPYEVAELVTGQPQFKLNADPSDYYGDINELAGQIYASLGDGTDRAIEAVMGDRAADAERRGMESSSYDIATRRMAADFAAERMNKDKQTAVERAFQIMGGYGDLAQQGQSMEVAELQGVLGQDSMALGARGQDYTERMGGLGAATELMGSGRAMAWGDRSSALGEIGGIRSLAGSDSYDAAMRALSLEGGIQGLRQNSLNEIIQSISAPYSMRASGGQQAAAPLYGAGQQYTDLAKSYAGAAGSAGTAAATWFDQANKWWS